MNKTVELVTKWAEFEETHPDGSLDDFCRHYLGSKKENKNSERLFRGDVPPRSDIVLAKLIDRIARIHMIYIYMAMKELKIDHFEEFSLLSAIANLDNPRKTEVIYHTINELATGLNLLGAMKKRGYITEHDDPEDKRSKRLKLTPKGDKILKTCYERFSKIPEIIFTEMERDDIELCIQLLKGVEMKFSKLYLQHRNKPFDEVYKSIMATENSYKVLSRKQRVSR
jgi:DNA-binding MarR family transcriptional regulator